MGVMRLLRTSYLPKRKYGDDVMITESAIYWVLKCDDMITLSRWFIGLSIGCVILSGAIFSGMVESRDIAESTAWRVWRRITYVCAITLIISILASTFIPTTKQMAMIKVIPWLANNKVVEEMGNDAKEIYKLGIQSIKEQLKGKGLK